MSNILQKQLNYYGSIKEPFLFVVSYDLSKYYIKALKDLPKEIKFQIDENINLSSSLKKSLKKEPIKFEDYKNRFDKLQEHVKSGNSYLLNLTNKTKISCDETLDEIYEKSKAKYKLKFFDEFVCFSPEKFIEISNDKISTHPMKGTIEADIKNAREIILSDEKEMAEHTMVVDLLRNDLAIVSKKVNVEKFRYIEKINAGDKELYQVSSKISGDLESNWHDKIGDIIVPLLPAGSITGTPKKKTVEILKDIEDYDRDYYTGIFGVFDGENLNSSVMIRFIEKDKNGSTFYKSGGGITCDSNDKKEYQEMIDKIYLPF